MADDEGPAKKAQGPNIDQTTISRLAYIRYLYTIGIQQSRQPEPLSSASILTFHDSVELFLQLASEVWNASPKQIRSLWDSGTFSNLTFQVVSYHKKNQWAD